MPESLASPPRFHAPLDELGWRDEAPGGVSDVARSGDVWPQRTPCHAVHAVSAHYEIRGGGAAAVADCAIGLHMAHLGAGPQRLCGHGRAQEVDQGGPMHGHPLAEAAFQVVDVVADQPAPLARRMPASGSASPPERRRSPRPSVSSARKPLG